MNRQKDVIRKLFINAIDRELKSIIADVLQGEGWKKRIVIDGHGERTVGQGTSSFGTQTE